ncbi:MAG: hypothetical protein KDA27_09115 [Candidatus Eisenbacteria bacterium]|uniref:Zinc-finger domain-containing protein n=1 Tax=Eiseniibacteriota bacterium TaxID=2212470 RepID=A0A956SF41_UNCEI|nr:hypothetical protein [Candidatus Eisenbacteria bacterium]MCB9466389.1 hypothetical protein [Candidatus Eisenbacteria bacterium]
MRITDDVIRDLLPLYAAGEASAATRELVETYLADRPDLAAEAAEAKEFLLPSLEARAPSPDLERRALAETQKRLRRRTHSLPFAILFSTLPFSFYVIDGQFHWLFWPKLAIVGSILLAVGLAFWIVYLVHDRRLRLKGF